MHYQPLPFSELIEIDEDVECRQHYVKLENISGGIVSNLTITVYINVFEHEK